LTPELRLPGDVADGLRQRLDPVVQFAADARLHAIGPGAFDQGSSGQSVSSFGDSGPSHRASAGMLRPNQSEIGHELPGIGETREIANFGDKRHGDDESHAPHGLQRRDDRSLRPSLRQILDLAQ
jgi:hypothetical protein